VLAATRRSLALVVVRVPVLVVLPVPVWPVVPSRGLVGSRPLYSNTLTSGSAAAAPKVTVRVFALAPAAAMFFA
jgi:hypothetical protein